jgi:hypothetical protein
MPLITAAEQKVDTFPNNEEKIFGSFRRQVTLLRKLFAKLTNQPISKQIQISFNFSLYR